MRFIISIGVLDNSILDYIFCSQIDHYNLEYSTISCSYLVNVKG